MLQRPAIPDAAILRKIRRNDLQGWEELYEAYAPSMLGIICKLTNNKKKGEQLLVKIFTSDEFEALVKRTYTGLSTALFKYAFFNTLSLLQEEGSHVDIGTIEGLPGIYKVICKKDILVKQEREPVKNRIVWLPVYGPGMYSALS